MNNTVSASVLTELALLINFPFKSLSILGPHVGTATTFWFVLEVESLLSICLLLIWESGIFSLYYIKKKITTGKCLINLTLVPKHMLRARRYQVVQSPDAAALAWERGHIYSQECCNTELFKQQGRETEMAPTSNQLSCWWSQGLAP